MNSSEIAAECTKRLEKYAETVANHKDRFIKRCLAAVQSVKFVVLFQDICIKLLFTSFFHVSLMPFLVNKDVCSLFIGC